MQSVELVGRHLIDESADRFRPLKIPGDIEMLPTERETGGVFNSQRGHIRRTDFHQRSKALYTVESTRRVARTDADFPRRDFEFIAFGRDRQ